MINHFLVKKVNHHNQVRFHNPLLLLITLLTACTAVPDPTPTPIQPISAVTVVVERPTATFTPTASPAPTTTPTATPTATVTETAVPSPTLEEIVPLASSTPEFQWPELQWNNGSEPVTIINDWKVKWSPITNEFIFAHCQQYDPLKDVHPLVQFSYANAPFFIPVDISQAEPLLYGTCETPFGFTWSPDGQQIVFIGTEDNFQPIGGVGNLWMMDRTGNNVHLLANIDTWIPHLGSWLNDETLFFQNYSGGGSNLGIALNINTGEYQETHYVLGTFEETSNDYIAITHGTPIILEDTDVWIQYQTVALINRPDKSAIPANTIQPMGEEYLHWLSLDYGSAFSDWLPGSNKMLVLTWQDVDSEIPQDTSLQLWDVDTGSLTMIAPGGWLGVFSPNGRYLTFYTRSQIEVDANNRPIGVTALLEGQKEEYLHLLDFSTGQIIISIPAITQRRFANQLWSPNSQTFIYQDQESNFALFDVISQNSTLLTLSGGERLSNPQWSFDGSYLSVTVLGENGAETAVLHIP